MRINAIRPKEVFCKCLLTCQRKIEMLIGGLHFQIHSFHCGTRIPRTKLSVIVNLCVTRYHTFSSWKEKGLGELCYILLASHKKHTHAL